MATASKQLVCARATKDGLSRANDSVVVFGRMFSSLSTMMTPLISLIGSIDAMKRPSI